MTNASSPCFMLVAGELSGDILGAGLIKSLQKRYPQAIFFGIGGPAMQALGLINIAPLESLSIMGLIEVIKHLPELLSIKKQLVQQALELQPHAFIGIDAPDFNIRLAKTLKSCAQKGQMLTGFKTFQYVSPSIWVWREGRVHAIKKAVDHVLCLFPFEVPIYEKYKVPATCVGHTLADEIPIISAIDQLEQARQALIALDENFLNKNLVFATETKVIALLPGSRRGEVTRLIDILLNALVVFNKVNRKINQSGDIKQNNPRANIINSDPKSIYIKNENIGIIENKDINDTDDMNNNNNNNNIVVLIPAATPALRVLIEAAIANLEQSSQIIFHVFNGNSRLIMQAADAVLLASGTASLEAMLLKKPMIVTYKFNAFTAWLAPKIVKISRFSLPNILAAREIVPELYQNAVTTANIVPLLTNIFALNKSNETQANQTNNKSQNNQIQNDEIKTNQHESLIKIFTQLHQSICFNADEKAAQTIIDNLNNLDHIDHIDNFK